MSFRIFREIPLHQTFVTNIQSGGGGDCSCCDISATIDISAMFDVSATFDISASIDVSSHIDVSGYFDISSVSATYLQNTNNSIGKVMLADSTNLDAFGRLRVSEPVTLYESTLISDDQPLLFDTSGSGNAVYLPNESMTRLDVSSAGQYEIRQSHFFSHYQPGKSLTCIISFIFGDSTNEAKKRIGLFDQGDGVFLDQSGGILYFVVRTSTSGVPVERARVAQSNWNIDTLQGTGPSGFTLDTNYANILQIDMQWLGVGRVRCGFVLGGRLVYAHQFIFTDLLAPYIKTSYLPVRYEIIANPSISTTRSVWQICNSVFSEGGFEPLGIIKSYSTPTDIKTTGNAEIPILSIRLKPEYAKCQIVPLEYGVISSSGTFVTRVTARPTLTNSSFVRSSTQACLIDTSATAISGGVVIATDFITNQTSRSVLQTFARTSLPIQSNINGVTDILTISIQRLTGSGAVDAYAYLQWREIT